MVYSINWPNFIAWFPLLLEILGNISIVIICCLVCDSINFEFSHSFLINHFFYFSSRSFFYPFTPLKTPKIKILKNEKICWRYHHFRHVYQKSQSYDVRFLRYTVRQTEFFCHFAPFTTPLSSPCPPPYPTPNDPESQNLQKKNKKMIGDIILLYINVYHKWRS